MLPVMPYNVASSVVPGVTPPVAIRVGGVSYYEHWRCPQGCGFRFVTNDPFENGDADSEAAAHICK